MAGGIPGTVYLFLDLNGRSALCFLHGKNCKGGGGRHAAPEGRQIKLGRTLGYADCKVTDVNEKLLAFGTLTVMVLPGKAPVVDPPFPGKFLQ